LDQIKKQVVVVGAGPGGYVCAIRLAQLGKDVLLIDREAMGGVCLNWGCIPSKALIHVSKVYENMQHSQDMGISVTGASLDLKKTQTWKESVVKKLTGGVAQLVKANGGNILMGAAQLQDTHSLVVTDGNDKKTHVSFEQLVIACGSQTIQIPGFDIDGEHIIGSRQALELTEVPKRFAVIGGGVIGLEIGMLYQKFGAQVSVIELGDQLLAGTDKDIAKTMAKICKKKGLDVHLGAQAKRYEVLKNGLALHVDTAKGPVEINCDKILLSVGRRPNADGFGLDKAGLTLGPKGLEVSETLQTKVAHIYAIGDITGGALLAHKASKQGMIAAEHIAGKQVAYDVKAMPGAIFTDPEIGAVGLTEAEVKAQGTDYITGTFPFAASGKAMATGHTDGFVKLIARKDNRVLLGAHIIGPHASDLVAEATLGIEMGATLDDIALTVHAHPTTSESVMEAAEVALGHPIHIVAKKKRT